MREDGLGRDPDGSGSREPSPSVSASGFDPSRGAYRPISSAPATGDFLAFNRMTGWYVTRREGEQFPLHGWDGAPGVWYPQPSFWMPLPPAPGGEAAAAAETCKGSAEGEHPIGKAEAPINSTMLSALKAMDEALTNRFADPGSYNATQQLWGGVTEAWIQIRSAISQAERG